MICRPFVATDFTELLVLLHLHLLLLLMFCMYCSVSTIAIVTVITTVLLRLLLSLLLLWPVLGLIIAIGDGRISIRVRFQVCCFRSDFCPVLDVNYFMLVRASYFLSGTLLRQSTMSIISASVHFYSAVALIMGGWCDITDRCMAPCRGAF